MKELAQAITELLKLLLVALSASGRYSTMSAHQDNEASIMRLLVTLAVTALAPTHGVPHRDVAALVQQLVLRLVAGPSAPAFREALSTLAPASVQALQVSIPTLQACSLLLGDICVPFRVIIIPDRV